MFGSVSFGGHASTSVLRFAQNQELITALAGGGTWFIVADFEGRIRGWQFDTQKGGASTVNEVWSGPKPHTWNTSHSRQQYESAVSTTRQHIAEGDVYQANICRVLSAPLPSPAGPNALTKVLASGNPAPFLGHIQVTSAIADQNIWLASASPELFFELTPHQNGARIASSPIKGTAKDASGLTKKDEAENVMITDLVRNDLSPVCVPGTVAVRDFLNVETHPGLVHLVSTVEGEIATETLKRHDFWNLLFTSLLPPGSVSGAPKSSALQIISNLESHHRGPYCGGFGWINADTFETQLAVGIRSFWWEEYCIECNGPTLHFGAGAGITWGSDPTQEWEETQLKAERLIALASGEDVP